MKHDIPLGRGVVGYAAQAKEAVLVPDVAKSPRYIATNPETRSELAVPLIYQEKVIGVLDLEHMRRGYFTEDHKRTLTTLAAQLAIAIENARLYEEIARQESALGAGTGAGARIAISPAASFACRRCRISRCRRSSCRRGQLAAISTTLFPIRFLAWALPLET